MQIQMAYRLKETAVAKQSISYLEAAYIDAAEEAQSKHLRLLSYMDEFERLLAARSSLIEHPDFSGILPKTFWTGNADVDPHGLQSQQGLEWNESGPQNWT